MAEADAEAAPAVHIFDWSDIVVLAVLALAVFLFFYRRRASAAQSKPKATFALSTAANGSPSLGQKAGISRSILQKMEEQKKDMVLFFGSQTGTAEDYASRLAREAKQYGFQPLVADMEQYELEELKQLSKDKIVFFVVATYGEGEPTDNAQEAYRLYHEEEHDRGCMANLNYIVFGLGNKTYEHYNSMGKFWDAKMADLGGNRLFEMGLGDDDGKYVACAAGLGAAQQNLC